MVKIKSCKVKNANAWLFNDFGVDKIVVEHYGTKIAVLSNGVIQIYNKGGGITASDARAIMQATGLAITRRNGGVQCLDSDIRLERFN